MRLTVCVQTTSSVAVSRTINWAVLLFPGLYHKNNRRSLQTLYVSTTGDNSWANPSMRSLA
ncbi:hypothetical protein [Nostoc sp.]|uniref:hypothetical protein n=1 Tax=Nostoc sp. TaxID=1180 RepID=UPI002FF5D2ED